MHCITFAFSQCFMHYRCVFICWNLCAVKIGFGWNHDAIFFALHMLMHFHIWYSLWWCFSVCLPLSLFRIVCAWQLKANLLHLGTLFILGHLPLILLLFMFGSVMRRPVKTSQRTSPNMAFNRNIAWFYQTFPILLYPLSFIVGDGNLYVRYSWDVPPWSFKRSTPTWYLYISICYADLRYTYCSHSRDYFRDTTCSVGIAYWLPCLSTSEDYVQGQTSVSFLWDTFFMGWAPKHLMFKFCERSKIPKHGDDIRSPSIVSL